jgi:hypothetical protein
MPTFTSMHFPPPAIGVEFEKLTLDALKIRWGSSDLQLIGRSGQAQQGVDIYGPDDFGQSVGVQCKKRQEELTIKDVKEATVEADSFLPVLPRLYVATTQVLDARLQQEVRLYSQERLQQGKFPVMVLFWDDLINSIITNPSVLKVHYPQLALPSASGDKVGVKLFALFDLVFYGKTLDHWATLLFGEWGQMSGTDPESIFWFCSLVRKAAGQVLGPNEQTQVETLLTSYEGIVRHIFGMSRPEKQPQHVFDQAVNSEWKQTEIYARRLADNLSLLQSELTGRALAVYELAALLARWEELESQDNRPYEDKEEGIFSAEHQQKLRGLVAAVAPATKQKVEERLARYNADYFSRSNVTASIFSAVHATLVLEEIKAS